MELNVVTENHYLIVISTRTDLLSIRIGESLKSHWIREKHL
jgi:hypothetical protein